MVTARANVKRRLPLHLRGVQIHRCDDRDVWQVRAAVVGIVQHIHIAGLHLASIFTDDGLDAFTHGTQVHGHVRRIGNQITSGVKQSATEVKALFDVHRVGGVLQLQSHLLGDVHEEIVEDLQQYRVNRGACCKLKRTRCPPFKHKVV